jgi:hypothetical protein
MQTAVYTAFSRILILRLEKYSGRKRKTAVEQ